MTSTLYPTSPNLTVPSTQNTAPVLSYNCLYTHDLRRKAKRWQDGVLKYHTFNKRIMVYDVPRNFIGDTHWRESQAIQDGDELELEKGVLIQIGEEVKVERTETDLTELLEKRKPKPTCDGPKVPLPAAVRTPSTPQPNSIANATSTTSMSAAFSQLRPKSLNALLGRPKGPVGRATLPSKSPAEQRYEKENNALEGARSPKRRRIQHSTDLSPTGKVLTSRRDDAVLPSAHEATRSNPTPKIAKSTNSHYPQVSRKAPSVSVHVAPEISPPNRAATSKSLQQPGTDQETFRFSPDDVDITVEPHPLYTIAKERQQVSARQERKSAKIQTRGQRNTSGHRVETQAPSNQLSQDRQSAREDSSPYPASFEDEPRPENLLRIVSSKPRRKLMYRDLLPQKAPPQPTVQSANGLTQHNRASHQPSSKLPDKRIDSSLSAFHQAQRDRLDSRLSKRKKPVEISENDALKPPLSLREDEGEDLYTPDKSPAIDDEHDPKILDSLFLSQSSLDEPLSNSSNLLLDQSEDPPDARNTFVRAHHSQHKNKEGNLHVPDKKTLPNENEDPTAQFAPGVSTMNISGQLSDPDDPSSKAHNEEDTLTSTQAARTLTEMDSLLLRRPAMPPDPIEPQPRFQASEEIIKHRPPPEPRIETIKAAMPPQPLSRPLQRSVSDLTALAKPDINAKRTECRRLLKSLSNDFTPMNVPQPPQPPRTGLPPIQIQTTNLYAHSDDKDTVLVPDSRPGSAKEQTVESWSREAFDLFGFDGMEKRVGTSNGVADGKGGGGMVRGEDGWLVASQGFV
ncbi:MAG: hypothetical protein Q9221_002420 [Calogaya cf. arnoldii]